MDIVQHNKSNGMFIDIQVFSDLEKQPLFDRIKNIAEANNYYFRFEPAKVNPGILHFMPQDIEHIYSSYPMKNALVLFDYEAWLTSRGRPLDTVFIGKMVACGIVVVSVKTVFEEFIEGKRFSIACDHLERDNNNIVNAITEFLASTEKPDKW